MSRPLPYLTLGWRERIFPTTNSNRTRSRYESREQGNSKQPFSVTRDMRGRNPMTRRRSRRVAMQHEDPGQAFCGKSRYWQSRIVVQPQIADGMIMHLECFLLCEYSQSGDLSLRWYRLREKPLLIGSVRWPVERAPMRIPKKSKTIYSTFWDVS